MNDLSIGELAEKVGLRASALRYYERLGLLPTPGRINGRRRYSRVIVPVIKGILFARRVGFSLAEIHQLYQGYDQGFPSIDHWAEAAREKLLQIDKSIEQAIRTKQVLERSLECDCKQSGECIIQDSSWWLDKETH